MLLFIGTFQLQTNHSFWIGIVSASCCVPEKGATSLLHANRMTQECENSNFFTTTDSKNNPATTHSRVKLEHQATSNSIQTMIKKSRYYATKSHKA